MKIRLFCLTACCFVFTSVAASFADEAASSTVNSNYPGNRSPLAQKSFIRLPFGSIAPAGWLKRQLEIEADGLTRHLLDQKTFDRCIEPIAKSSVESEVSYQKGVYQEGIIVLAYLTRDEVFLKRARESIELTLAEDPAFLGDNPAQQNAVLYRRSRQIRAFIEYFEATRDERIVEWMKKFYAAWGKFDGKLEWWPESATTDLFHVGYWLYNLTGERAILDTIESKSGFTDAIADSFLDFPSGKYETHNVVVAWISKAPAMKFELNPEDRYRRATFEGIARRERWFGQIGGRYTGHEHYCKLENGRRPTNGTELCGVVEYMYSMELLMELFGRVDLADRLESLAYNSLPGACTPDFFSHQYDQQANQVNVSVAKRGFDNSETANLYGFAPHYPCCSYNMHAAWPRLVENMWMASPDGGLAAVVYGPCKLKSKLSDGQTVAVEETTDYPFKGDIRISLGMEKPAKFPLYLRIPAWAEGASVAYRGEKISCKAGTMFKLERTWQGGDELTMTLPLNVRTESRFNRSIAVLRGPLYYSLRIGQKYRDLADGRDWEILPTTPWNYALAIAPAERVKVVENPIGDFPFAQRGEPLYRRSKDAVVGADGQISSYSREPYAAAEPVVIRVKGRLLPEWGMDENFPTNAADPPPSPTASSQPEVDLELIPYGCARLRISEFPRLKDDSAAK
jgi:hypothetical protein